MPMLTGSQNTIITGGHFTDQSAGVINNITLVSGQTGIDILLEASNCNAVHDSSARDYAPRCHPGTREQQIEDTVYWAVPTADTGDPLSLIWMEGPAGVGKSAIAQTCAEQLKERNKLGATFFFSVNGQDKAAELIPTIVYQLCIEFPDYRDLVDQRIRHDRAILTKTMEVQFRALIIEPLQDLERAGKSIGQRIAIIIDGLDECNNTDAQCKIIEIVAAAVRDGVTPFCWAFFSRPEPHIEASFALVDVTRVALPISSDTNPDIELYLRSSFKSILRRRNIPVEPQWPSDDDIQTLVNKSDGLFIYAATALRVVDQAGSLEEALRAVCSTTSNRADGSPFAELDACYMLIMRRIPPDVLPTVLLLCMLLCSDESYAGGARKGGVMLWRNLMALSRIEFQAACNHLSAVLHFHNHGDTLDLTQFGETNRPFQHANPAVIEGLRTHVYGKLGGTIYFYHKSFFEFLCNPKRSGTFCVTSSSPMDNSYFKHSLEVLLGYEESYRFRGSGEDWASFQFHFCVLSVMNPELVLAPGVADSAATLSWPYTNELVNSMLKASVYDRAFDTCFYLGRSPGIEPQLLERFGRADFRKARQIEAMRFAGHTSGFLKFSRWGYKGHCKLVLGTQLFCSHRDEFERFDVARFKAVIKRWKEHGIIQSYRSGFTPRLKYFIPKKFQSKRISGLYRMGHGSKSIFWYWEINFKLKYYREFRAADLAEGQKIYREERFDLWPTELWQ